MMSKYKQSTTGGPATTKPTQQGLNENEKLTVVMWTKYAQILEGEKRQSKIDQREAYVNAVKMILNGRYKDLIKEIAGLYKESGSVFSSGIYGYGDAPHKTVKTWNAMSPTNSKTLVSAAMGGYGKKPNGVSEDKWNGVVESARKTVTRLEKSGYTRDEITTALGMFRELSTL